MNWHEWHTFVHEFIKWTNMNDYLQEVHINRKLYLCQFLAFHCCMLLEQEITRGLGPDRASEYDSFLSDILIPNWTLRVRLLVIGKRRPSYTLAMLLFSRLWWRKFTSQFEMGLLAITCCDWVHTVLELWIYANNSTNSATQNVWFERSDSDYHLKGCYTSHQQIRNGWLGQELSCNLPC